MRVPRIKKITTEQYVARFNAEKARLQRHYCNIFKFWRSCRFKPCRKARACRGDQNACLKQSVDSVPRTVQYQARQRILTATANADSPERTAREFMPNDFYELLLRR